MAGDAIDMLVEVFMVRRPGYEKTFCIYRTWKDVEDEFDGAEDGDTIYVTKKTMTQTELDSLRDFEGW